MERIYIARHGFRLNWVNAAWTKSETGLARDPPLASYGVTQAQELAQHFASLPEEERPTAIFSSPFYRCLQTAQPTAQALGLPIHVEHGIGEWYSPVVPGSGLHPRPGSALSLKQYFPEIDPDTWSSIWYPSRKGEFVPEVHSRIDGFLTDLSRILPQLKDKGIDARRPLFVSHAATVIVLVRSLTGDREMPLRVGCCSLSELHPKEGEGKGETIVGMYRGVKLADGAHLKKGSEREWGMEDIEVENGRVVEDPGEPGSEHEEDFPIGSQLQLLSNL